jgi:transcriptional regulator GlxA family with amidase domain
MVQNLARSFDVSQVANAINVSVRTLQYACLEETGQSPMAMAKRLRLRQLRTLLQDSDHRERSISDLMESTGLLACGTTAADYRSYCGETPRQTRQGLRTSERRPAAESNRLHQP